MLSPGCTEIFTVLKPRVGIFGQNSKKSDENSEFMVICNFKSLGKSCHNYKLKHMQIQLTLEEQKDLVDSQQILANSYNVMSNALACAKKKIFDSCSILPKNLRSSRILLQFPVIRSQHLSGNSDLIFQNSGSFLELWDYANFMVTQSQSRNQDNALDLLKFQLHLNPSCAQHLSVLCTRPCYP